MVILNSFPGTWQPSSDPAEGDARNLKNIWQPGWEHATYRSDGVGKPPCWFFIGVERFRRRIRWKAFSEFIIISIRMYYLNHAAQLESSYLLVTNPIGYVKNLKIILLMDMIQFSISSFVKIG